MITMMTVVDRRVMHVWRLCNLLTWENCSHRQHIFITEAVKHWHHT